MLSIIIFLPLVGVLALYLMPNTALWRWIAVSTSAAVLIVGIVMAVRFNWNTGALQFEEHIPWIPALGASYHLGIDGLSFPLILLTTLLTFLALLYAWKQERDSREYFALYLVMEAGLLGFFSTMDLLLFYFFFEVALVPMYFITGLWGHEQRVESAMKYFLYTRVGSLAVLLSILALYLGTNPHTFDLPAIIAAHPFAGTSMGAFLVLLGFLIGFGIKLPVVPLHSWLPDAHTSAPTEGSVVLAGLLLKLGGYGLLRLALPTVPAAFSAWAVPIAAVAVVSAVYGAAVAMAQPDLKRMIASLGLPALADFAAEVQIVLGTLGTYRWAAFGMLLGVLITTAMFLWTLQRILLGKTSPEWMKLPQLSKRELATLLPLMAFILLLGIFPGPLVQSISAALHSGVLGILLKGR